MNARVSLGTRLLLASIMLAAATGAAFVLVNASTSKSVQAQVNTAPQIPIIIRADGVIIRGTGFSVTRQATGSYVLEFPPRTFLPNPTPTLFTTHHPVVNVSPHGLGALIANLAIVRVNEDGGADIVINVKNINGDFIDATLSITITE